MEKEVAYIENGVLDNIVKNAISIANKNPSETCILNDAWLKTILELVEQAKVANGTKENFS